uniref:efflux transporter outer membrane subunit n=1 Tax=uncultured Sphingomonas sp. TaxID=158754 RepID=UPI0035CC3989
MIRRPSWSVILLGVLVSACATVGPDVTLPKLPADLDRRSGAPFEASGAPVYSLAPPPGRWWRLYDDPRLDALVEEALAVNTDLRVAAASLERAEAAIQEVRATAGLQTNVTAGATAGQVSTLGIAPAAGVHSQFDAAIGVSYEVDVVGRIRRSIEAATATAQAQAAARDLARTVVAADVVDAYATTCVTGARIAVAQHSLALQQQSLALTRRGVRGGVYGPLDAVRSGVLVSQLQAAIPPLEGARRVALYRLAVLGGHVPTNYSPDLASCTTIPTIRNKLPIGDGMALIKRRPDIRQAERELAAATATIGVETAALYPSISLGLSAGSSSRSIGGLVSNSALQFSAGPLISWTIPNRSVARARIAEANATARGALATFDGQVLIALRETESALTLYTRDLEENAHLAEARDQSRQAANLERRLVAGGTASSLELLDVQRTLATAEATLAQSDAILASDRIAIYRALGGGWEQDPS